MKGPTGLEKLPRFLAGRVQHWIADWCAAGQPALPTGVSESLPRVWAVSHFVAHACLRNPPRLTGLCERGQLQRAYRPEELRGIAAVAGSAADLEGLKKALREIRNRELARIAWRDIAGWADLEETLRELSELADACVETALRWLERNSAGMPDQPRNPDGQARRPIVLGMGKLGGHELNFSSDIDLILSYPEDGEATEERRQAQEAYFQRMARELVQVLSQHTAEGFVYRVDTALRPFGKSGPLVMGTGAVEQYYQAHGREWERYALIKARPIAGDIAEGEALLQRLRPFVYRRYLDYGTFESLRDMKALIQQQVARHSLENDIKLGPGGIREIEFIAQVFQLIRGGNEPALQERSLLRVLETLQREEYLPAFAVKRLREAYVFLRRAENRIQAWDDQQTHELPADEEARSALALAMDCESWDAFLERHRHHQQQVQQQFEQVFATPRAEQDGDGAAAQVNAIFEGALDEESALKILRAHGLADGAPVLKFLRDLQSGVVRRGAGPQALQRLSRLLPLLFAVIRTQPDPDTALLRALHVIEAIALRATYLSLLVESPMALSQLVSLCAASPWITSLLSQHPVLLDELLDPRSLYRPPARAELAREIAQLTEHLDSGDIEPHMEILRRFRQVSTLRVAAADVSGQLPLMKVSDHLTWIAEVILDHTLALCRRDLAKRFGRPVRQRDGSEAAFVIIGYGKLGGIELGYGSDLDLVFLHDGVPEDMTDGAKALDHASFFTRLAQRIIHLLSTRTPGGVAYEVDTQLRPSGRSGLLVSGFAGFRQYQLSQAWTWEHQSLVRARVIAGDAALGQRFAGVRHEVLCQARDATKLLADIADMRRKMRAQLEMKRAGLFDLKQGAGGIIDIEFLVQCHVLRGAHRCQALVEFTDNIRQLEALGQHGFLEKADAAKLADCYRAYRTRLHALDLGETPRLVGAGEFAEERHFVSRLWHAVFAEPDR